MVRFTKFVKVENNTENECIEKMIEQYDNVIARAVNLIPLSEVLSTDDEDGIMKRTLDVFRDGLALIGTGFDYMIEQDNQLREIKKQNEEILKKLNELSKEITK